MGLKYGSSGLKIDDRHLPYVSVIETYLFNITDSAADGLTGNGYYAIYDKGGREILHSTQIGPFTEMSHKMRIGYSPEASMDLRDKAWLTAHNLRREAFHGQNNEAYVPLMWSNELEVLAENHVDHMLENCNDEPHAEAGIEEGQNVAGEKGIGQDNDLDPPEEVLMHWVDQKKDKGYPENMPLTQVYWRASKYVGCASGSLAYNNTYCERHACMYITAGNCVMGSFNASTGDNWIPPTLETHSNCGPICPDDGCYVDDFDGL